MARRAILGNPSLSPFGGGGLDFGAFNILDAGNEAYLAFLKVQTAWEAGKASDTEYLAALEKYANAQPANSSDRVSLMARLEQTRYRIERNILVSRVEAGDADVTDLITYDKNKLAGLATDSEEYRQRLELYRQSQARWVSEREEVIVDRYQAGQMTTTQLRKWYQDLLGNDYIRNNPELEEEISGRITELTTRVQDEQDTRMVEDFNDGKVATADFLAYAASAKARYAAGTSQALEWQERIDAARDGSAETSLLYRYNLSQQYAELQRFVQSNSGKPAGGTSTSTQTRVILGADGTWKTVKTTSTKATAPSAAEQKAYAELQIEIASAKRQMAEISAKAATVGGWVSTESVMGFYQKQATRYVKGSEDWYRIQEKLDSLNDRLHSEQVYSKQGIKITYPKGGGGSSSPAAAPSSSGGGGGTYKAPSMAGGGGIGLDQFMAAIARQESGGRYDARNKSSGAYGKYQIMPANWSSWAQKAGLPGNAPQTPENQERVARAAFERLAKSYNNDWSRVAAAWFAGVAGSRDPNAWGPKTRRYVDAIMSHLGTTRSAVSGGGGGGSGGGAAGPRTGSAPAAPARNQGGPLAIVKEVKITPKFAQQVVVTQPVGFPTGLDGRAFERFYANYERAFNSGQESFVDTTSGTPVHYYIGDDPAERIERMRQLDDLRVGLYDERAVAYEGTASELTAMNQRNEAYKDLARHEYQILATAPTPNAKRGGRVDPDTAVNPLAAGIRLLDKQKASVQLNLAMAKSAFERGDITGAYSLLQMAQRLTQPQVNPQTGQPYGPIADLAGFASASEQAIAAIAAATGGIDPGEALGSDGGGKFAADLERLRNFDAEMTALFDADASEILNEIKSHVAQDAKGNVLWDETGPKGKLVLTDDSYFKLDKNGKITLESKPPTFNAGSRSMSFQEDGMVTVRVKAGNDVIQAEAEYVVEQVGAFIDPNDPSKAYPIMGKVVQQRVDGKWVKFYENPMAPGTSSGWSSSPHLIKAPKGFVAQTLPGGEVAYTFQVLGSGRTANQPVGGWTYTLQLDPKTGTYSIYGSKAGGLLGIGEVVDQFIAGPGDANFLSLFKDAGFAREPGSAFDVDLPIFGMTPAEYEDFLRSAQPPAMAAAGTLRGSASGVKSKGALAGGGAFASLEDREQDYIARSRGAGASEKPTAPKVPSFGGWSGPRLDVGDAPRRNLPPQHGGLSPDARDEIEIKTPSSAPTKADRWFAEQKGRTSALPPITAPAVKKYQSGDKTITTIGGKKKAAAVPAAPKAKTTKPKVAKKPIAKPKVFTPTGKGVGHKAL